MQIEQAEVGNGLLRALAPDDFELLASHLTRISLPVRLQLHEAGSRISQVYFPEDGIVSIVAVARDGSTCEVGLFGREGMSETATVLGTDNSPHEAYVQVSGITALKLPVVALNEAFEQSSTLRRQLLRYAQAMMIQLSSSVASAGMTIQQRLARWLLMCHDRIEGDEIVLTNEFIAMMLNVRRAGITVALGALDQKGVIKKSRGKLLIRDRHGLELIAGGGYGLAESEYERLIGTPLRRT